MPRFANSVRANSGACGKHVCGEAPLALPSIHLRHIDTPGLHNLCPSCACSEKRKLNNVFEMFDWQPMLNNAAFTASYSSDEMSRRLAPAPFQGGHLPPPFLLRVFQDWCHTGAAFTITGPTWPQLKSFAVWTIASQKESVNQSVVPGPLRIRVRIAGQIFVEITGACTSVRGNSIATGNPSLQEEWIVRDLIALDWPPPNGGRTDGCDTTGRSVVRTARYRSQRKKSSRRSESTNQM
mmetsp:Transcript_21980/g.62410  ORF Transcript_21980/g.62410 Transcript_21980/m.62410 type:complete len:238 (+) Transcript_21980:326-1039(+)